MKKILCLLLCAVMVFSLCGCAVMDLALEMVMGSSLTAEQEAIPRLGFSKGELFDEEEKIDYFRAEEFADKQAKYSQYRGRMHYDSLDENEQTLYHALEYAMENGYNNILVDDLLIEDLETLPVVLEMLALDSPLLEQNYRYEYGDFTSYYPVEVWDGLYEANAKLDGYYLNVKSFEQVWWDKKMTALEKAVDIVEGLPEGQTTVEKAAALYRFASEEITYDADIYGDMKAVAPYLYDGLINQKTQCDGKANALSLLLNIAGIPCVEKTDPPSEEIGHTWNLLCIDGKWYNADATASGDDNPASPSMTGGIYFAFSDLLCGHETDNASIYPDVPHGLLTTIDAEIENGDDYAYYKAALPAFNRHHREWCLVLIEHYDEEVISEQVQDLADYYLCTVRYYALETIDGRTAFLAFLEED